MDEGGAIPIERECVFQVHTCYLSRDKLLSRGKWQASS